MSMKLKVDNNGKVRAKLKTGKDYVRTELSSLAAQHIIDNGKLTESTDKNFPICVNDEWFFEGVIEDTETKKTAKKGSKTKK